MYSIWYLSGARPTIDIISTTACGVHHSYTRACHPNCPKTDSKLDLALALPSVPPSDYVRQEVAMGQAKPSGILVKTAYVPFLSPGVPYQFLVLVQAVNSTLAANPLPVAQGLPGMSSPLCPPEGCTPERTGWQAAIQPSPLRALGFLTSWEKPGWVRPASFSAVRSGLTECGIYNTTVPNPLCTPYVTYKIPKGVPQDADEVVRAMIARLHSIHGMRGVTKDCVALRTKLLCQELHPQCLGEQEIPGCTGRIYPCLSACELQGQPFCPDLHGQGSCNALHNVISAQASQVDPSHASSRNARLRRSVEEKCCIGSGARSRVDCLGSPTFRFQPTIALLHKNYRARLVCDASNAQRNTAALWLRTGLAVLAAATVNAW